jgi:hypothetical protein
MSKKSKLIARDMRRKQKASKKDAMRALYASWTASGDNSKRKNRSSKKQIRVARHVNGPCTNQACTKCFNSSANNPWLAPKTSCLYSKRFTSSKWRNAEH